MILYSFSTKYFYIFCIESKDDINFDLHLLPIPIPNGILIEHYDLHFHWEKICYIISEKAFRKFTDYSGYLLISFEP